jgi:hypothetical protein
MSIWKRRPALACAVLVAFVLVLFAIDRIVLAAERHEPQEPASEIQQNGYYCQLLKEGSSRMVTEHGDLKALCSAWGVNL